MYATADGVRSRIFTVPTTRLVATFVDPQPGKAVILIQSGGVGVLNKFDEAVNDTASNANIIGVILAVRQTAGVGIESVTIAPCGEEIPLKIFGSLAALNALGNTNTAYLGTASGGIIATPGAGTYARRVFRLPQSFASLTAADRESLYVQIIEEVPVQV